MGAGSTGMRVIKALRADGVGRSECLYGSTVQSDAGLGSRLLVVFSERGVLSWDQRAREIQETRVLIGVCGLGKAEDRFAVPALEELANLANQAGVHSTVAIVSLPLDHESSSCRQRCMGQLQDIRKAFAKVIPVDANLLLQRYSGDLPLENASRILDRQMAACVAIIRQSTIVAAANDRIRIP